MVGPLYHRSKQLIVKFSRSIAVFAVLVSIGADGIAQTSRQVNVQILAINDLHGNLDPPDGPDGAINQTQVGGIEYLATHLRQAAADHPNSILVGAGDLIGASPLLSGLFQDRPTIEALNAMNLAMTALGNHELDHGPDELLRLIKSTPARFEYLAANVTRRNTRKTLLPPTAIRTVGGVKIGFIGEIVQTAAQVIKASSARELEFTDEVKVANEAAARLEKEGVHAIVLLLHDGGTQHPASGHADPNACVNLTDGFTDVARRLSPAIKVVVSGHSHQAYNCEIGGHLVTSASSYGRMFTRINLTIDGASGAIVKASAENELVTRDVQKDVAVAAILDKYRPEAERLANRAVGRITGELGRTANGAGESPLGDVVCDALLEASGTQEKDRAAVAFMPPGGIRAALQGRVDASGNRTVSYADLYKIEPFHNQIMVLTMTGDMIYRMLEQQFTPDRTPRMMQVSEGFTYQYRLTAPSGEHVVRESIKLHGKPIAANDQARVAVVDFLATGGSGFTVFTEAKSVEPGPLLLDGLVEYFGKHSPVAPTAQNRIQRLD
jgi:5'-nucleotidase